MAHFYHLSLDDLIEFDIDVKELEQVIENTSEESQKKIDWTKVWSKKYPVLSIYQQDVDIEIYAEKLRELLCSLQKEYGYNELDSMLVLKDILAHSWKKNQ